MQQVPHSLYLNASYRPPSHTPSHSSHFLLHHIPCYIPHLPLHPTFPVNRCVFSITTSRASTALAVYVAVGYVWTILSFSKESYAWPQVRFLRFFKLSYATLTTRTIRLLNHSPLQYTLMYALIHPRPHLLIYSDNTISNTSFDTPLNTPSQPTPCNTMA